MRVYMNGIKKFAVPLSLAMMTMTAASAVQAASFSIDDSVVGELTLNHDGNFEFGATSNGTVFAPYAGGSTTTTGGSGESGTFSGSWYAVTGQTGIGTVYIVEPGTNTVIATVAGTWSSTPGTPWDTATIDLAITSSACGANLGELPTGYPFVNDPAGYTGIGGAFVDGSGSSVLIPSNLGMGYTSNGDADCDGVLNDLDYCPGTVIPEATVPSSGELGVNRHALTDGDGVFDTVTPNGEGPGKTYTIQNTGGCSCEQIIDELELGKGQTKKGCSASNMDYWINDMLP